MAAANGRQRHMSLGRQQQALRSSELQLLLLKSLQLAVIEPQPFC